MAVGLSVQLRTSRHIDLTSAAAHPHVRTQFRPVSELHCIKPAQCRNEPPPSPEQVVGKADHATIWPSLRPKREKASEKCVLVLVGMHQREKRGRRSRRTRDAHVAMDEDMSIAAPAVCERTPERQDCLDMLDLRKNKIWRGVDLIVEAQGRPIVRLIGSEYIRFRNVGIQDRQNVCDAAGAMAIEFVERAYRRVNCRGRRHNTRLTDLLASQKCYCCRLATNSAVNAIPRCAAAHQNPDFPDG